MFPFSYEAVPTSGSQAHYFRHIIFTSVISTFQISLECVLWQCNLVDDSPPSSVTTFWIFVLVLQNLSELHKHYFLHILLTEKSNDRKVKWYAVLLHVITSENLGHPFPAHTISAGIGGVFFFPASSGNSVTHCVSHSYAEWCPVLPGHVHNKTFAPLFSWNGFGITKSSLVLPVFECFKPVFPSFWRKYHKTDTTRKYYKTDSMIYMHTSEVLGRHFQKHKC